VTLYQPIVDTQRRQKRARLEWSEDSELLASFIGVEWLSRVSTEAASPDRNEVAKSLSIELQCPVDLVMSNCPWLHCAPHFWQQDPSAAPAPDPLAGLPEIYPSPNYDNDARPTLPTLPEDGRLDDPGQTSTSSGLLGHNNSPRHNNALLDGDDLSIGISVTETEAACLDLFTELI